MYGPVLLLSLVPLIAAQSCQPNGTWSAWYLSGTQPNGYDYCGACLNANFSRTCETNAATCPCVGINTQFANTNTEPCLPPREPCCPGFTVQADGNCGPISPALAPDPTPPNPPPVNGTSCTAARYWGAWGPWSACNSSCGACGVSQRIRPCASVAWGCPCPSTASSFSCQTKACGEPVCTTGPPCCGNATVTVGYDGTEYCNPFAAKILAAGGNLTCDGLWAEWTGNGVCSASCGACGSKMEKRACWPSGCHCDGPFNRSSPCNAQPCPAPSQPCCPTYGVYTDPATGINSCATCNSSYLWAEWTDAPGAVCADYCGSCATIDQVRKCASGCCPANGQTTQTVPCGLSVCLYPRASCCAPYKKVIFNSTPICGLDPTTTTGVPNTTTTTPPPCPPGGGTWSVWSLAPNQNGFDVCGSCWLANYVRTCLDGATCPCVGSNTAQASANVDVCLYPRYSCCPGKTKQIVNGTFICGPLTLLPPDSTPLTCTQYGAWGGWNSWSTCSATCGMCGVRQRNRTCTSEPGCPCKNPDIDKYQTERCGGYLCPTGSPCCNGFALVKGYDGYTYCGTSTVAPVCTGTWSAWYGANENYPNTTTCTDSCGNCGLIAQYRFCYPSGCQCPGSRWQNVACGNTVCLYPRQSCCTPYKKSISGSTFICG